MTDDLRIKDLGKASIFVQDVEIEADSVVITFVGGVIDEWRFREARNVTPEVPPQLEASDAVEED